MWLALSIASITLVVFGSFLWTTKLQSLSFAFHSPATNNNFFLFLFSSLSLTISTKLFHSNIPIISHILFLSPLDLIRLHLVLSFSPSVWIFNFSLVIFLQNSPPPFAPREWSLVSLISGACLMSSEWIVYGFFWLWEFETLAQCCLNFVKLGIS